MVFGLSGLSVDAPDVATLGTVGRAALGAPFDGEILLQAAQAPQATVGAGGQGLVEHARVHDVAVDAARAAHAEGSLARLVRARDHLVFILDRTLALGAVCAVFLGPARHVESVAVVALQLDHVGVRRQLLVSDLDLAIHAAAREDLLAFGRHADLAVVVAL